MPMSISANNEAARSKENNYNFALMTLNERMTVSLIKL